MDRERAVVLSTRVTTAESARVRAVAAQEGRTVSDVIHGIVMTTVDERLIRELVGSGADAEADAH